MASLRRLFILQLTLMFGLAAAPVHAADPDREITRDHSPAEPAINNPASGAHIEGRIAFMKTELMITPEQEGLWNTVADAMRADVRETDQAMDKIGNEQKSRENTIQYLKHRAMFARLRADGEERFLSAMQPLYASMSASQKQAADALLAPDGNE